MHFPPADHSLLASFMVSFVPPEPKVPTVQQFYRQPPRGPVRGVLHMLRIAVTDFYYPRAVFVNLGLLALCAIPLVQRENFYFNDAKKGTPWDRVLAGREKKAEGGVSGI